MSETIDMTGRRYGKLTVERKGRSANGMIWLCRCDCGNIAKRKGTDLRRTLRKTGGANISCGCTHPMKTHGQTKTPLYGAWNNIKNRCYNKNINNYHNYGGRGIKVCNKWRNSFEIFYAWAIANGYKKGLSIERIDVNGNYTPENCTWIPLEKQCRNRRDSRRLTWQGITLTPIEWSEKLDISHNAIQLRVSRGWSCERIFTQPYRKLRA